jgi:hypothetical protein
MDQEAVGICEREKEGHSMKMEQKQTPQRHKKNLMFSEHGAVQLQY